MARTVHICPMGDSLTEGDGNSSAYRFELFRMLKREGVDFDFVGANVSGDQRLPERYQPHCGYCGYVIGDSKNQPACSLRAKLAETDVQEAVLKADILLLMIGTNDIHQNLDLSNIYRRYDQLLAAIWRINPAVTIYVGLDHTRYDFPSTHVRNRLAKHLANLATPEGLKKCGHSLRVVDMAAPGYRLSRGAGDFPPDDGHPNYAGNRKLAEAWFRAILPQVKELAALEGETLPRVEAECLEHDMPVRLNLKPLQSYPLHAFPTPIRCTDTDVYWNTTDPMVATVDDYGLVTPLRGGTAMITASMTDGAHAVKTLVYVSGSSSEHARELPLLYETDFTSTKGWSGGRKFPGLAKRVFQEDHRMLRADFREPNGRLEYNKEFSVKQEFWFEFSFSTSNDKEHVDQFDTSYFEVGLGKSAIRITGGGQFFHIVEEGVSVGRIARRARDGMTTVYGLLRAPCYAAFEQDNHPLIKSNPVSLASGGKLYIEWKEDRNRKRLYNLRLYGK